MTSHNLFATILTAAAPSSNYRGESEENRTVLQKITRGNHEYPVISPESMRNALRDILAARGLPSNRRRLANEEQLAVEFKEIPDADKYADDFLFGYMVADPKVVKDKKHTRPTKRDSVLRMNMAVALSPLTASTRPSTSLRSTKTARGKMPDRRPCSTARSCTPPINTRSPSRSEIARSATARAWTRALLAAIGELTNVAGGHARSYYEMAPRSLVARLTPSLVAGFDTYGFRQASDDRVSFPELARITASDLPGHEFWIGGEIVRSFPADERARLTAAGAHLYDNPQRLLADLADAAFGKAAA
jgi:CRISPR-associated protein Cst2